VLVRNFGKREVIPIAKGGAGTPEATGRSTK